MDLFCTQCGASVEINSRFCSLCGVRLEQGQLYETDIKNPYNSNLQNYAKIENHIAGFSAQVKETFSHATQKINTMVGGEGDIDLNLKDVFSDVLKKHTKEEGEILFTSGTKLTTPSALDISTSWPKPWLFSRVFTALAITYIFLSICTYFFQNLTTLPGLIMVGSFAVPFSLLIFFWETNAPQNISIYEISKMFFIGGASSLVITLFLYSFVSVNKLDITGAVIVGIIEELGKLVIIAYFIGRINPKYILNGLLIGAAIGAGFASFESAGYAFTLGTAYGNQVMLSTIFNRAWESIGTHTVWAAISGAALVFVKGSRTLERGHFANKNFIKVFLVPIILHALWDMPFELMYNLRYIILIVIAWLFIFSFINSGLKQISRINREEIPPSFYMEQKNQFSN